MSNSLFLAIRSNDGNWKVVPTKFDRQVGDAVVIKNEKYTVVTTGDRDTCIETMRFSIQKNRQHIKNGFAVSYPAPKFVERELLKK